MQDSLASEELHVLFVNEQVQRLFGTCEHHGAKVSFNSDFEHSVRGDPVNEKFDLAHNCLQRVHSKENH